MIMLTQRLAAVERDIAARRAEFDVLRERGQALVAEAKTAKADWEDYEQACAVLSRYADARQDEVRSRLEGLVTRGLRAVFDEELTFVLKTKTVGKRLDTELMIRSMHDGAEIETPILDSRGGGVASVTGFLLQVILVILQGSPRLLFLDESFAQVSAEYEPRLAAFVDELATELGIQVVMVTHSNGFEDVSDVIYRTSAHNGITTLERVR